LQVPSLDIALAWHAHLRFPIYYRKDSMKQFGHILDHGDEHIDADYTETARLWEHEFHEKYEVLDIFPPDPPKISKRKQQQLEQEEKQRTEQIIQTQLEAIEKRLQKERVEQEELKKQEVERVKLEAENEERRRREIEGVDEEPEADSNEPPKRTNGHSEKPDKNVCVSFIASITFIDLLV